MLWWRDLMRMLGRCGSGGGSGCLEGNYLGGMGSLNHEEKSV